MKNTAFVSAALIALVILLASSSAYAAEAMVHVADDAVWANGELYGTVVISAGFTAPPDQTTDNLYAFDDSVLSGQALVSDSAPGDTDYNGGRWSLNTVAYTAAGITALDTNNDDIVDFELTSEAEVLGHAGHGHIIIINTGIYFECPLIPQK